MLEQIQDRLRTLQTERAQVAGQIQTAAAELERLRFLLSAYDGAIGELSQLVQAGQEASEISETA